MALANAPGTGISDDKAVYAYVPQIIKYYLGEDQILKNVPTFVCWDEKQCQHVIANIEKLVVKPTNESGGYGIVIGPKSTAEEERADASSQSSAQPSQLYRTAITLAKLFAASPRLWTITSRRSATLDLRPYILYGKDIYVCCRGADARRARKRLAGQSIRLEELAAVKIPGSWQVRERCSAVSPIRSTG